jgi:hypothetical protein
MAGTSKKVWLSAASCPKCLEKGTLKRILYGMPGFDFDHEKYIVGGCVVSDFDPEIGCTRYGWEGMRGECS